MKEPQDNQSELEFWEGMFGKSTNAKGNTEGYITYHDFTERLNAYVTTRVKEALEAARSKDPHKCEFGHEVYSHNTVDGWCCACEADQAFMEAEIEARVKEAERLARIDELGSVQLEYNHLLAQTFRDGQAMTDSTQELDEILKPLRDYAEENAHGVTYEYSGNIAADIKADTARVNRLATEAKQAILDWHNKQVLEMLKDEQHDDERSVSAFKYMGLNKLKEGSNDHTK